MEVAMHNHIAIISDLQLLIILIEIKYGENTTTLEFDPAI